MVTKEEFEAYVRVQRSGVTNMLDVRYVAELSGLSEEQVRYIISNYSKLKDKFEGHYVCLYCGKKFAVMADKVNHVQTVHAEE